MEEGGERGEGGTSGLPLSMPPLHGCLSELLLLTTGNAGCGSVISALFVSGSISPLPAAPIFVQMSIAQRDTPASRHLPPVLPPAHGGDGWSRGSPSLPLGGTHRGRAMDVCRPAGPAPPGQQSLAKASGICCNVNKSDNPAEVVLARPEPAEEASPHPCSS